MLAVIPVGGGKIMSQVRVDVVVFYGISLENLLTIKFSGV